ncbi:MAG: DNA repair protein RadC [Chloroflexota bacterium]|nr:DNA repair protein RadC [Chloroflexota bacterium]
MDDAPEIPYTLIRDLPETDRPRERLRDFGAPALSNQELLAILLRVGSSKESAVAQAMRLLSDLDGLAGLRRASFAELCSQRGVGEAKAAQIFAALELGIRVAQFTVDSKPILRSPEDIASIVLPEMSLLAQEHVRVMLLDARNRLLASHEVYVGSVHTASVRVGELLSEAVKAKAAAIVLVHNHPSGDPTPSAQDIELTKNLHEAARLMDIDFFDHIVIGGGRFVSMHRTGLGFPSKQPRASSAGG